MRKIHWLISTLALGLGILIGISAFALGTAPDSAPSFIAKFSSVLSGEQPIQQVAAAESTPVVNPLPIENARGEEGEGKVIPSPETQQIIADYKQDLGIFFDAWKSQDMTEFRTKLAKAYTGQLFEKHARRAEEYLVQGIALEVNKITFDQVVIENASNSAATLRADYRYKAQDYSLEDAAAVGPEREHDVHVRVNLVKINSHWLITGESLIE